MDQIILSLSPGDYKSFSRIMELINYFTSKVIIEDSEIKEKVGENAYIRADLTSIVHQPLYMKLFLEKGDIKKLGTVFCKNVNADFIELNDTYMIKDDSVIIELQKYPGRIKEESFPLLITFNQIGTMTKIDKDLKDRFDRIVLDKDMCWLEIDDNDELFRIIGHDGTTLNLTQTTVASLNPPQINTKKSFISSYLRFAKTNAIEITLYEETTTGSFIEGDKRYWMDFKLIIATGVELKVTEKLIQHRKRK